jgi:hypothetical protein
MTPYEIISIGVSIIAVVIAIISNRRSIKLKQKQLEFDAIAADLNKKYLKQFEEEEKTKNKANVSAELVKIDSKNYRFVVTNYGPAEAYNIYFVIDSQHEDNPLVQGDSDRKLPYPSLKPGQSFELLAAIHMQSEMSYKVHLTWENKDGTKKDETINLSI